MFNYEEITKEIFTKINRNLIPYHIIWRMKKTSNEIFPSINLDKITSIFSKEETILAISYLKELGISVNQTNPLKDPDIEEYEYYKDNQESQNAHKLTKEETIKKFMELIYLKQNSQNVQEYLALNNEVTKKEQDKTDELNKTPDKNFQKRKKQYIKIMSNLEQNDLSVSTYLKLRNELVISNKSLVESIARKINYEYHISMDDATQYGYEALVQAVELFDPTNNYSFLIYAWITIWNKINYSLNKNSKLNKDNQEKISIIKSILKEKYGLDATDEEIEEELSLADPSIEESDNTYEDIDNYDYIDESDYEDFLNIPRYLKENKSSDSFLK